ncbi:hypothetical protein [Micromonospora chalcea]|uniref:hypothetical protein n=1 Tax=Micromonospora chalcea TaxID=1874 RepID=UPI002166DA70|nr:hypothetical protein [Micromonospora chalcea]
MPLLGKPAEIFDRDVEWAELARFVADDRPGATLGVVSGRRRQGKTLLLYQLAQASGGFYFGATEATSTESLRRLGEALGAYSKAPGPVHLASGHGFDDDLVGAADGRPDVVLVDPARLYRR